MKEEIAKMLLEIKAVTINPKKPYRFVSGILSPIYCDNRIIMSYPDMRKKVIDAFIGLIEGKGLKFDIVAGTATAGIPHAAWISERLNKPMIYVRDSSKEHGKQNRIEGLLEKGKKVLVIEDLVSTGGSSISAVEAVKEAGGIVEDCVAIFTYGFRKAKKKFEKAKCNLHTLSDFSTLVDVAVENGHIEKDKAEMVKEWNSAPVEWGKKMGFE